MSSNRRIELKVLIFFLLLGDYIMIAGRLLNPNLSDRVIVDSYKIQSFKTFSQQELTWPFEVVDISQRVYHV